MKVLWVGDAAVSSGFARCTNAVCDALIDAGHMPAVLGINYWGDPHKNRFPIFPPFSPVEQCHDGFGNARLPKLIKELKPDVVVLLNDPWNVDQYMVELEADHPPVVGWLAVDARNHFGEHLNKLAEVVTWTEFGMGELRAGGYKGSSHVVPLGVDRKVFKAYDKAESRRHCFHNMPDDVFLVGVVGRNQPRKRLDLTIQYFAEWVKNNQIENVRLYIHVAPTGDMGFDVGSLIKFYGMQDKVIIGSARLGYGVSEENMARIYSCMDVYLTTSQAEGWGLPAMEAMACGVPCVLPNWAAYGEWAKDAALMVDCPNQAVTGPWGGGLAYTIGGVPSKTDTMWALHNLYKDPALRSKHAAAGLALTARPEYQWENVGKSFVKVLEEVVARPKATVEPEKEVAVVG